MDDLIEALKIFRKYMDDKYPTHCEHDVLFVSCPPEKVSDEDVARLEELGFHSGDDDDGGDEFEGGFYSFRFGSC